MSKIDKFSKQMMRAICGTMVVMMPPASCISAQASSYGVTYCEWHPSAENFGPETSNIWRIPGHA